MDDPLHQRRDYLLQYLNDLREHNKNAPIVQQMLEQTEWQLRIVADSPSEAASVSRATMESEARSNLEQIRAAIPRLPRFDPHAVRLASTSTSSAAGFVVSYIQKVGALGTPETIEFANKSIESYEALQRSHEQYDIAIRLLDNFLFTSTKKRLELATNEYHNWKAGLREKAPTALAVRTAIDGLKGDVIQRARRNVDENMTWSTLMTERLLPGKEFQAARDVLLRQDRERSELISALSDVGKDRNHYGTGDLRALWARTISHFFVVLTSIQ